ncbi:MULTISPECIES: 16S rRNA (cytosine(1402)-N(4))-methyltransferase RsmH [Reichenbachiella]|uniref:Ribosomal RNA small subunit methyltransferase H n=1 Tax=Reichenbachiella agariperforans TaxID=156994 RepID=A0A1M6LKG1_REIAG|nr:MULTISPECIES: 16S rRNA (cytosine(1402)-N(4))-methyltransferase RsmH [Reichenbachiella]RJE74134.1 16S rRNA (cytosine(1402)-N(4))-methyltransferase [Reichenbachiella sp. MSK19-1]SHJ71618.1 16S rRNA (cytosine1402-N4)-methyltransferase [Reichenbachiella agariperforans]
MSEYHNPVMLRECVEGLDIKSDGIYIDVTFGGGGHSQEILKHIGTDGRLFGFDQDDDARANADQIEHRSFTFVQSNFRYLKKYLRLHGVTQVDGILADLGVSSHQFNTPGRGFSTRFDGPLDMRMDTSQAISAKEVINEYDEKALHKILGQYGEVKNAKTLAAAIVTARGQRPMETIGEFLDAIRKFAPRGRENKYFAQVFQAIRIEVNEELKALEEFLVQSAEVLKENGKLVIMSYHSLEDRMVKNYINKGKFYGEVEKDLYGNQIKPLQALTRKPIVASDNEINENNRARSAKLRIAEKI